jgi:hypothetical protein
MNADKQQRSDKEPDDGPSTALSPETNALKLQDYVQTVHSEVLQEALNIHKEKHEHEIAKIKKEMKD